MYDPMIGRFLEEDPIWPEDHVNPFVYAGNNPLIYTDPTGLEAQTDRLVGFAPGLDLIPVPAILVSARLSFVRVIGKREYFSAEEFAKATGLDKSGMRLYGRPLRTTTRRGTLDLLEDWGCIGVTGFCLNLKDLENPPPHEQPNVKGPWLEFEDAKNLRGVTLGPNDNLGIAQSPREAKALLDRLLQEP